MILQALPVLFFENEINFFNIIPQNRGTVEQQDNAKKDRKGKRKNIQEENIS